MTKPDKKAHFRRYIEEMENTGNGSNSNEFISEEYEGVYEGVRYQIGIEGATN